MDWQSSLSSIMNSPLATSLVSQAISKPAPAPKASTPVIQVQNPMSQGMSPGAMIGIGAAVLAVVGVLFLSLRKK